LSIEPPLEEQFLGPWYVVGLSHPTGGEVVGAEVTVRFEGYWAGPFKRLEEAAEALENCEAEPGTTLALFTREQGGHFLAKDRLGGPDE
jgi:hypothetical protein